MDDNGFVSNYWYDADGERTVKTSGESDQVYVNGVFSGGSTNTAKFSLYVSPYLVANQGGRYTKHIYAGSQRIVSKIGDFASYGSDPRRIEYAGANTDGLSVDYKAKYAAQQQVIKDNYKTFDVPYNGTDNDNYADGEGFCCNDGSMEAAVARTKAQARAVARSFKDPDNYENLQFFYHPDHLGSSSFITNLEGEVVQHIEYVPFGEVFIEERNNVWNTPYLFNAKEFDEETGMYCYGARYYEPRLSLWISVDRLCELYSHISPYTYTANNPIICKDINGDSIQVIDYNKELQRIESFYYNLEKNRFEDLQGNAYSGDNSGIKKIASALNTIASKDNGKALVQGLVSSEKTVSIRPISKGDNSEAGISDADIASRVNWVTDKESPFGGPAFISLAHELAHALDRFNGTLNTGTWYGVTLGDGTYKSIPNAEKYSTHIENLIRTEQGYKLRTHYSIDSSGRPDGGQIITDGNKSLYFNSQGNRHPKYKRVDKKDRYIYEK